MKAIRGFLLLCGIIGLAYGFSQNYTEAASQEKLYVCGPCSSPFIKTAGEVVNELNIPDRVIIKKTTCLGACSEPPVLEFRGQVYTEMTAEKLKAMLEYELDL